MADQILEQVRELAEGQIVSIAYFSILFNAILLIRTNPQDFEGQKLSEFLATALLATVGVRVCFRDFSTLSSS